VQKYQRFSPALLDVMQLDTVNYDSRWLKTLSADYTADRQEDQCVENESHEWLLVHVSDICVAMKSVPPRGSGWAVH
jgi:hypothetical protein